MPFGRHNAAGRQNPSGADDPQCGGDQPPPVRGIQKDDLKRPAGQPQIAQRSPRVPPPNLGATRQLLGDQAAPYLRHELRVVLDEDRTLSALAQGFNSECSRTRIQVQHAGAADAPAQAVEDRAADTGQRGPEFFAASAPHGLALRIHRRSNRRPPRSARRTGGALAAGAPRPRGGPRLGSRPANSARPREPNPGLRPRPTGLPIPESGAPSSGLPRSSPAPASP